MQEPVPGISAVPDESNARYFHVVVAGERSELLTYSSVPPSICLEHLKLCRRS